jgi:cyclic lactone autoinducer peptide
MMKKNLEKTLLSVVKGVVENKEKKYEEYYRSPVIFHQPKRPKK